MTKTLLKLILFSLTYLSFTSFSYSQKGEAQVYFKDGSIKNGNAKILMNNQLRLKTNDDSKKEKYDFDLIDRVKIKSKEDSTYTYVCKPVKNSDKKKVVKEIITDGIVHLYAIAIESGALMIDRSSPMPSTASVPGGDYFYFLQRNTEKEIVDLNYDKSFKFTFRKGAMEYFKDCHLLVEKLKKRDFKRNDIVEIVKFYNSRCK